MIMMSVSAAANRDSKLYRRETPSPSTLKAGPGGGFRKLEVPYFGVLIIRILLFRVLH